MSCALLYSRYELLYQRTINATRCTTEIGESKTGACSTKTTARTTVPKKKGCVSTEVACSRAAVQVRTSARWPLAVPIKTTKRTNVHLSRGHVLSDLCHTQCSLAPKVRDFGTYIDYRACQRIFPGASDIILCSIIYDRTIEPCLLLLLFSASREGVQHVCPPSHAVLACMPPNNRGAH